MDISIRFVNIPNSDEKSRGIVYDIFATYNLMLLDEKYKIALNKIRAEYNYMKLPDLEDNEFYQKLSTSFREQLNLSLTDVIHAAENDGIFEKIVVFLKQIQN